MAKPVAFSKLTYGSRDAEATFLSTTLDSSANNLTGTPRQQTDFAPNIRVFALFGPVEGQVCVVSPSGLEEVRGDRSAMRGQQFA